MNLDKICQLPDYYRILELTSDVAEATVSPILKFPIFKKANFSKAKVTLEVTRFNPLWVKSSPFKSLHVKFDFPDNILKVLKGDIDATLATPVENAWKENPFNRVSSIYDRDYIAGLVAPRSAFKPYTDHMEYWMCQWEDHLKRIVANLRFQYFGMYSEELASNKSIWIMFDVNSLGNIDYSSIKVIVPNEESFNKESFSKNLDDSYLTSSPDPILFKK